MSVDQDALITATEGLSLKERLRKAPKLFIGKTEFTFDPEELSPENQARATKELRETPENVEEALKTLRELLKGKFERCIIFFYFMLLNGVLLSSFFFVLLHDPLRLLHYISKKNQAFIVEIKLMSEGKH